MTPTDQALLEEIEKRDAFTQKHLAKECFTGAERDRSTLIRLLKEAMAQQRTPSIEQALIDGLRVERYRARGGTKKDRDLIDYELDVQVKHLREQARRAVYDGVAQQRTPHTLIVGEDKPAHDPTAGCLIDACPLRTGAPNNG